jgi:glycosyltransferase involved in cell wall biosynthesis
MSGRVRVLHSIGHLLRGGIETWLYQMITRLDPARFEHHLLVWTDEEEQFSSQFREAGAKIIPCLGHSNPIHLARNLRSMVATNGPYDILHTHGTHLQGFVMALVSAFGVPALIAHSHNDIRPMLKKSSLPYRLYSAIGYAALRHYSTIGLGVSDMAAECMFGSGWRSDSRWRLLYCGIDFQRFFRDAGPGLREELTIPEGRYVIGHVGRFVKQKNHMLMIEILDDLVHRDTHYHMLFIGDGPMREQVMAEVQRRGLSGHVTSVLDTNDVSGYLTSAMDCFLFPSTHEGLGLAAVEAQAAGLPCLLSDVIPSEVVVNTAMCRRIAPDAPASLWANEIIKAPSRISPTDPDFQETFLQSRFNIDQCVIGLAEIYETLTK